MPDRRATSVIFLACLMLPAPVVDLRAQETGWAFEGEANASLFFGNTRQTTIATRYSLGRTDSLFEVETDGQFTYGEAQTDDRRDHVTKRSWRLALTADHRPFAVVSPFVLASIEASLETRIERRISAGAGAKYVVLRRPGTTADISLALLTERTLASAGTGAGRPDQDARYSARVRLRRALGARASLAHETFYRPEVGAVERFTLSSRTTAAVQVAGVIAVQASFIDNYDSEARARGARSNNDGELLFGLGVTL